MRLWYSTTETVARLLESPGLVHVTDDEIREALMALVPDPDVVYEDNITIPVDQYRVKAPQDRFQNVPYWYPDLSDEEKAQVQQELREPHWKTGVASWVLIRLGVTCPLCADIYYPEPTKFPIRISYGLYSYYHTEYTPWYPHNPEVKCDLDEVFRATCPVCWQRLSFFTRTEPGPLTEERALLHLFRLASFKERVRANADKARRWRFHPLRYHPVLR